MSASSSCDGVRHDPTPARRDFPTDLRASSQTLYPHDAYALLRELDKRLEHAGLFFVRYMDDIAVLAPTRWKLRRAVKIVNATLADLGLEKHPEKTFIGRVEKGFDFLGYRLSPQGLSGAAQTLGRFAEHVARLH